MMHLILKSSFAIIISLSFSICNLYGQAANPQPKQGMPVRPPVNIPFEQMKDSLRMADNMTDSLRIIYDLTTARYLNQGKTDKMLDLINYVLKEPYLSAMSSMQVLSFKINRATINEYNSNYFESIEECLKLLNEAGENAAVFNHRVYMLLGRIFTRIENYDKALEYYELALKSGPPNTIGIHINMASLHLRKKNWQGAIEQVEPLINFNSTNPNQLFALKVFIDAHLNLEQVDECKKALDLMDKIYHNTKNPKIEYDYLRTKMSYFNYLENYDSAFYYADLIERNPIAQRDDYSSTLAIVHLYKDAGDYSGSLKRAKKVYEMTLNSPNVSLLVTVNSLLYHLYEEMGESNKALFHLKNSLEYEKKMKNEEIERVLLAKEADFLLERAETQKTILQANLNRKNIEQNFTITVLSFIFLSLILTFILFNKTKKNNTQLAQKNGQIEQLMKELNHRMKNNLQLISSILNLQSNKVAQQQAKDVLKDSKLRMQALSIMHQNLFRTEDEATLNPDHYFSELLENLKIAFSNDQKEVEISLNVDPMPINMDYLISLGLIINEMATNSLKHAQSNPLKLSLTIKKNGDMLSVTFADNGEKIDMELLKNDHSFGMEMIYSLVEQINGELEIRQDHGLSYHFSFLPKV